MLLFLDLDLVAQDPHGESCASVSTWADCSRSRFTVSNGWNSKAEANGCDCSRSRTAWDKSRTPNHQSAQDGVPLIVENEDVHVPT